jgi:hypothetical protein
LREWKSHVILLAVMVSTWVGADTILSLFANTNWTSFNELKGALG